MNNHRTTLENGYSQKPRLLKNYNGRVNIITPESPNATFQMQERMMKDNKSACYTDAMKGTFENTLLSKVFFSKENIQIIQNAIRAGVYKCSGEKKIVVAPQNVDNIMVVMRAKFLQFSNFYEDRITEQVERLNSLVIDYCVRDVYSAAVAYLKYMEDQSTLVVPLAQPLHPDRNYKQLEFKPFIY